MRELTRADFERAIPALSDCESFAASSRAVATSLRFAVSSA